MEIDSPTKIKQLLKDKEFEQIIKSEEFYFQKGQDKLEEWLNLKVDGSVKNKLIKLSKSYEEFKVACEQDLTLKPIADILYSIISYCDYRA